MKKILLFTMLLYVLSSCSSIPSLYTETDKVTGTRYVKCEMFLTDNDFREPGYSQKLIISKELKPNQEPQYIWYDVVTLSVRNFDLDVDDIYLLIDDEVFPLKNTYEKQKGERKVNEQTQDVMRSDSTKVSVVTGYDVVEKNVYQMKHPVSAEVMDKILDAQQVILRYSVGAQFINSEIRLKDLDNLKKLIATNP